MLAARRVIRRHARSTGWVAHRAFSSKVMSVDEAISDIKDGSYLLCGGFGICGIPSTLFEAIRDKGIKDLTCVSNNAGIDMTDVISNLQINLKHTI